MKGAGVVVADTTPLNYLILIGETDLLGRMFGEVWIPEAVIAELRHPKAPEAVKVWLNILPVWIRIMPVRYVDPSIQLGQGESEAISLALENQVKVVLMDERRGREAAASRGLIAVGTLNLIDIADEQGEIDGVIALRSLRQTNFRAEAELLDKIAERMASRRS